MTIDFSVWGDILERFGLPIAILAFVGFASLRGLIVWRWAFDVIIQLYKDALAREKQIASEATGRAIELGKERDALLEMVGPLARAAEKTGHALSGQRQL